MAEDLFPEGGLATGAPSADVEGEIFRAGIALVPTDAEGLDKIGAAFTQVFEKNGCARNGSTFLNGALFALGSRGRNDEWREHCASSLRELFHEWKGNAGQVSTAFNNTFKAKNQNFPNVTTHARDYERMQEYYGFFSDICHHDTVNVIRHLRYFLGSQMKAGDDTPERFIEIVADFVRFHRSFFDTHVK